MDREGASLELTAASIRRRLPGAQPLPLHLPLGEGGSYAGVVDLVSLEVVAHPGRDGVAVARSPLSQARGAPWFPSLVYPRFHPSP